MMNLKRTTILLVWKVLLNQTVNRPWLSATKFNSFQRKAIVTKRPTTDPLLITIFG